MRLQPSRREFLRSTVGVVTLAAGGCVHQVFSQTDEAGDRFSFFHISDIHVYAAKDLPDRVDSVSWEIQTNLIERLNSLPGSALPEGMGGGRVLTPKGVVLTGDCIDSGDKNGKAYAQAQKTETDAFTEWYGLTGGDGRLTYPLYELHGNHDSPTGHGPMIDAIRQRNRRRPGLRAVSENGVHYSWDWGVAHFVSLGISVAPGDGVTARRRYNPMASLEFLRDDLRQCVGDSHRPVVLLHHLDVQRQIGKCVEGAEVTGVEWDPCEMMQYHAAIRPYNIVGAFYGHTHKRDVLHWHGNRLGNNGGISLFNVANSGHYKAARLAFFYIEISPRELLVRECFSTDRWQTLNWSPQVWRRAL